MRAGSEYKQNQTNKRGRVVERDAKKMRVKVRFEDEDETDSHWIDVLSRSSGSTKTYMMPNEGDEVWCALDQKGEDGCVIGSKYNDQDTPPTNNADHINISGPWGHVIIDGSNISVKISGDMKVEAGGDITGKAGGDFLTVTGGTIRNNDKNIGHDHKHKDVMPGGGLTGDPV